MVKEYGMSEKMGLVTFEQGNRPLFLNGGFSATKEYSEETAREIDIEIKRIIDESFHRVKALLTEKSEILRGMAKTLMEKEVIEGSELKKLLDELHTTNGKRASTATTI